MSTSQIIAVVIYVFIVIVCVSIMVFVSLYPSARSEGLASIASDLLKMTVSALIGAASVLMGGINEEKKNV